MGDGPRADALAAAVQVAGHGVAEIADGRVVEADERFCELTGYTREELLRLPGLDPLLPPSLRGGRDQAVADVLAVASTAPAAAVLLRRDGVPVDVAITARDLDAGDGVRRTLVLVADATEQVRQREQLRAFADVLQRMPLGMILWRVEDAADPLSLRVLAINRAAAAGSGRRPDELVGRTIADLFGGEQARARADGLVRAHRTRQVIDLGEYESKGGDGFFVPGTYRRAVIPLAGDLVASLIENVTARREADRHRRDLLQRILDAAGEERRRVAVGLHDDVIQTLAATLFELDAVRRAAGEHDGVTTAVGRAETAVRGVIGRLRSLVFELTPPELDEGLEVAVDVAAGKIFEGTTTRVTSRFDLDVEPDGDTAAIVYLIVAEALANARRHAAASRVEVELRSDDDWLVGAVRDDGRGAADLVTPPGHLGLRTLRERVELLGGTCSVESRPGTGTAVSFRVPTTANGGRPTTVAGPADSPGRVGASGPPLLP